MKPATSRSWSGATRWELRGCGLFTVRDGRIAFQRGYWDKLWFLRLHRLPVAPE